MDTSHKWQTSWKNALQNFIKGIEEWWTGMLNISLNYVVAFEYILHQTKIIYGLHCGIMISLYIFCQGSVKDDFLYVNFHFLHQEPELPLQCCYFKHRDVFARSSCVNVFYFVWLCSTIRHDKRKQFESTQNVLLKFTL